MRTALTLILAIAYNGLWVAFVIWAIRFERRKAALHRTLATHSVTTTPSAPALSLENRTTSTPC